MTPSPLPQNDPTTMKTASRSLGLLAVIAVVIVLAVGVWYVRGWQLRTAIMAELQPVALKNCTLKRFGSAHDGGYLMCENLLEALDAGYSYGVGFNDDWGCDVSRRYQVPVHQYDCFDPTRPTCDGGTFVFHDECIGPRAETIDSRVFDTLDNQIRKNGHTGPSIVVKIDVEGAEWDALEAAPEELLASIPQMAMELHGFDNPQMLEVLRKMNRHFHLVNLHFNNWSCTSRAAPFPARAYQVLWVNKRMAEVDPAVPIPAPMSPLNAPDAPTRPDCQLDR
jgi:hypothetical protein